MPRPVRWTWRSAVLCATYLSLVTRMARTFFIVPTRHRQPGVSSVQRFPAAVRLPVVEAGWRGGTGNQTKSGCMAAGAITAAIAGLSRSRSKKEHATALHGLKDKVRKDYSLKSAMIKICGKLVLQREFDMRSQIMEDPKLAKRCGMTQEELLADFERAAQFLRTHLGCKDLQSDICISKVATGLQMQHLGKPSIPTNEEMLEVFDWLERNLNVSTEDDTLRTVIAKYPFTLGRTIEELEESRRFCPIDIDYDVAVAEDPALIDKTYNCDGICANMCTACWYNG